MPPVAFPPREATLAKVTHPERLRGPDGVERTLVGGDLVDRLAKGDATFGWEGDPRFCLYVNTKAGRWELWRLEQDSQYRISVALPGFIRGHEIVPWLIKWIVDHDARRGFNPAEFVIKESIRTQKAQDNAASARHEEVADRLHHALLKDVGHVEAGISRRQF